MVNFLRAIITKDDRAALDSLLDGDDETVDAMEIMEVSNWLVDVITGDVTPEPASEKTEEPATVTAIK